MKKSRYEYPVPKHQEDSLTVIATPVSGTKYVWRAGETGSGAELGEQKNVRIISINAVLSWATTQPTPLEVHLTIDGQPITFGQTDPVSATNYVAVCRPRAAMASQIFSTADTSTSAFLCEGRIVKIEIEITWAVTQPTDLTLRVKWARW